MKFYAEPEIMEATDNASQEWKSPCQVPGCHGGDGTHIADCPSADRPSQAVCQPVCDSCETRPSSTWCRGCVIEDYQASCGCEKCVHWDTKKPVTSPSSCHVPPGYIAEEQVTELLKELTALRAKEAATPMCSQLDMYARYSLRWHCHHEGRTLIVYAESEDKARGILARHTGCDGEQLAVQSSGHYDYSQNRIINPQDGPVTTIENWAAGYRR